MEGLTLNAAEQHSNSAPSTQTPSPQSSRRPSRHNSNSLSLDLSDLPPLITPDPPSNTLLITNLMDPKIFHPASLATIRQNISRTASLYSFSPLKSFRRIVATFYSTNDAISVRQQLDGEAILGNRVRVFFGRETPVDLEERDRHLAAPASNKLFFISPPPSPPHGWEMRNEEPPNKDVHADDLAVALERLHAKISPNDGKDGAEADDEVNALISPVSPSRTELDLAQQVSRGRSGSTATVVWHPSHDGNSPLLPAVVVSSEEEPVNSEEDVQMDDGADKKIMAHTARPPVELMDES